MPKSPDDMVREMYQVIMGIPDTEEKGMLGDIKSIKEDMQRINGSVQANTHWRIALCWIAGIMATALGVAIGKIFS